MVCLNENLTINIKQMKNIFISKLDNIIEHELHYIEGINDIKKDKIKNAIIKEIKNEMNTDYFMYSIMDDKYCTYKHSRGKKEHQFCCKKITNNGNSKKYVCTIHNKLHIPKKKVNFNISDKNINIMDKYENNGYNNLKLIEYKNIDPILESKNKKKRKNINSKMIKNNDKHNTIIRKNINSKMLINKKIYIKDFDMKKLKNSLKIYNSKIICKYNENICYNIEKYGKCDFKHIDNKIYIPDLLYKNDNLNIKIDIY